MTDTEARELRDLIAHLQSRVQQLESALSDERQGPYPRIFFARPQQTGTETAPTVRGWTEITPTDQGDFLDYTDGRVCDDDAHASALSIASDGIPLIEIPDVDGYRYAPLTHYFPVALAADGGDQGSRTAPATYTYTVKVAGRNSETVIATGVSPAKARRNGRVVTASRGMAHIDVNGILVLWDHNERRFTTGC